MLKYSYTIGLGVSYDNSALYLSRFLPIDEIISQLIYLINEPVFFIQIAEIGYSNTGIYMNLEGDTIGSIFYCEEDPEFADKEQIHFLASNFSTFMAMINLLRISLRFNNKSQTHSKTCRYLQRVIRFFQKNSNLLPHKLTYFLVKTIVSLVGVTYLFTCKMAIFTK